MDYSTIKKKLDRKTYTTLERFHNDLRLIYSNSRKFNAAAPDILALTDKVEAVMNKNWSSLVPKGSSAGAGGLKGAGTSSTSNWRKQASDALAKLKDADVYVLIFSFALRRF